MELGLTGKWALVCGASKGLGWGCARALALEGVNVVMAARGAQALEDAAAALRAQASGKVLTVAADVTTEAGRDALFNVPGGPGRAFDIVVTNAGGPPPGDFRQWGREEWLKAVDANMLTPIELIKATVDGMAERGFGRIVNITSSAVKAPIDILGLSNGARSGLTGFVAGLARSPIAARGVTINNLLPERIDTDRQRFMAELRSAMGGISLEEAYAEIAASIAAGRLGTPEEFGAACAFLCSRRAGAITGSILHVDGGYNMMGSPGRLLDRLPS
jgi:3-oxoacyl-[acyl-carrier protein] reductase